MSLRGNMSGGNMSREKCSDPLTGLLQVRNDVVERGFRPSKTFDMALPKHRRQKIVELNISNRNYIYMYVCAFYR